MRAALIRGVLAALAVWALGFQPLPGWADERVLTPVEAARVAQLAYAAGDYALANALARRLVQLNPEDAAALLVLAATEPLLGNPTAGRMAGRTAWAAAAAQDLPDPLRYEIARYTARAAFVEGSPLVSQFWLRRALDVAPDPEAQAQTQSDIGDLRRITPLRLGLDLSVVPMSNLNNGAAGGLLTIDDDFVIGTLSGSARELPGVRATADVRLGYALPPGAAGQTVLGVRVFATANAFTSSAEEEAAADGLRASDLNRELIEVNIERIFLLPGSDRPVSALLATGTSWSGGVEDGPFLRAELRTALVATRRNTTWVMATAEEQRADSGDLRGFALRFSGRQLTEGRGNLIYGLGLLRGTGPSVNNQYQMVEGLLGYELPRLTDTVDLAVEASGSLRRYDAYSLGPFQVTDGRRDETLGLALHVDLTSLSVMGYVPRVTLSREETRSNISRFETRQTAIMLGVRTSF